MKKFIFTVCFLALLPAISFAASEVVLTKDSVSGKTTFIAKGWPSALKIVGTAGAPSGKISLDEKSKKLDAEFELPLDDLDTKLSLRNKHMKENYLETDKFPVSKLKVSGLEFDLMDSKSGVPFTGILTLHGVDKEISGKMDHKVEGDTVVIKCDFSIKTSDFAVKQVDYMGIKVAETIDLIVELSAPKKLFAESAKK